MCLVIHSYKTILNCPFARSNNCNITSVDKQKKKLYDLWWISSSAVLSTRNTYHGSACMQLTPKKSSLRRTQSPHEKKP